ncbi:hypothetical protein PIB30_024923, partial [Stylosanthes scabra]|nr:hypothetical protein [Stylosanthes scabra]
MNCGDSDGDGDESCSGDGEDSLSERRGVFACKGDDQIRGAIDEKRTYRRKEEAAVCREASDEKGSNGQQWRRRRLERGGRRFSTRDAE